MVQLCLQRFRLLELGNSRFRLDRFSVTLRTRAGGRVCRLCRAARGVHFPMFTNCGCAQPSPLIFQPQSGQSSCISSITVQNDFLSISELPQMQTLAITYHCAALCLNADCRFWSVEGSIGKYLLYCNCWKNPC